MREIIVNVFDAVKRRFCPGTLCLVGKRWGSLRETPGARSGLYLSPGFIDSHAHVYPGVTDLGIRADRIGLSSGVHLVVDAGSAGSATLTGFRDYVLPTFQTPVKAFLNISRVGLVTKQPYSDVRNLDVKAAVDCIRADRDGLLLGIKVMSSGIIVEDSGILPMRKAVEAAELAGCRVMAHLVEGPPTNEETMSLLRRGDIITHCFHGMPNISATLVATKGMPVNPAYYRVDNVMWSEDGAPQKPLADAFDRGVLLDVGHGAGSFDQFVARAAIAAGVREFSISSDLHIRNVDGVVRSLPLTMSKFLALGMTLAEVIASVTAIPAGHLGLTGWCDDLSQRSTLFRLRPVGKEDPPFLDSNHVPIEGDTLIEPLAVITDGALTPLLPDWAAAR